MHPGARCCADTETVPLLCQQHSYILNVGTYLGASTIGGAPHLAVHQRVIASSTSGVPTCRASGYAHPTQPHHESIVVAAPCAGQQGTCIQQPEDVFLQALVYKDVGRHKARPLQLTMVWCGRSNERPYRLSVVRAFGDCAVGGH